MCNLYSVRTSRAALARKFRLSDNRMAAFDALPAIFPGHMAPIIKRSVDGERELVVRSWGFILLRKGYAPKRVTNTRDDKIGSHFWRDSFAERRCLVPARAGGLSMRINARLKANLQELANEQYRTLTDFIEIELHKVIAARKAK